MQYSRKSLAIIAGAVMAVSFACPVGAQTAAAPKPQTFGMVDRDKVVQSYTKAQHAVDELKKSEEAVHKLIDQSNKEYKDAESAKKPPAELEGLQRRLQTRIDSEVGKVQARAKELETQLENEIDAAIKAEASARKVDVVILKQAVLVGGVDLTDGVVKRLASAAAPKASAK